MSDVIGVTVNVCGLSNVQQSHVRTSKQKRWLRIDSAFLLSIDIYVLLRDPRVSISADFVLLRKASGLFCAEPCWLVLDAPGGLAVIFYHICRL